MHITSHKIANTSLFIYFIILYFEGSKYLYLRMSNAILRDGIFGGVFYIRNKKSVLNHDVWYLGIHTVSAKACSTIALKDKSFCGNYCHVIPTVGHYKTDVVRMFSVKRFNSILFHCWNFRNFFC